MTSVNAAQRLASHILSDLLTTGLAVKVMLTRLDPPKPVSLSDHLAEFEIEVAFGPNTVVVYQVDDAPSIEMQSVDIMDQVQDDLMEGAATQWPMCPSHNHAALTGMAEGRPFWLCPTTRSLIAEIGSLDHERG